MSRATIDPSAPPTVRVKTRDMAYGPHAVAHLDGKVLFVRGAAPGEELDVTVREDRGSFAFADVVEIVRASDVRRAAPCPYLPRCGGCPWQHLDYAAQLAAKHSIVADQLRRIGRIDVPVAPVIPSPLEFAYRARLKLRVQNGRVGFYAGATHALVPIDHCLLAEAAVDAHIVVVDELAGALRTRLQRIEIAVGDGNDVVVSGEAEGAWVEDDEATCRDWLAVHRQVRGLALFGRRWQREWGDLHRTVQPEEGLELKVRAGSFTQVSPRGNHLLVESVIGFVEPVAGQNILDLYAGAGNLSLPLARRGALVLAVEQDTRSAADGKSNARAQSQLSCRFWNTSAKKAVDELIRSEQRFDTVLLDPPRSGAAEIIAGVRGLAAPRLVYVSCDPATLARDLRSLADVYNVSAVQPIDLFPHTYHIETVVKLERK